jgi:hypothetical protein
MWQPAFTVSVYVLLEAWRSRFAALLGLLLLGGWCLALFIGQVALTETGPTQAVALAAALRLGAAFLLSLFCVTSLTREFAGQGGYLLFAQPLSRSAYFFGKLGGFALLAWLCALGCGLLLSAYAPVAAAWWWGLTLGCELLLVACASLLCAISLSHPFQAHSAVLGFYLLARSISAFQAIVASPAYEPSPVDRLIGYALDLLGLLLPDLERFAQSAWLLEPQSAPAEVLPTLLQTAIYALLLASMALIDLCRKNL